MNLSESYIDPTREAFDLFKQLPRDEPINMLNLLRFNEDAAYPADHPNAAHGWSGARAVRGKGNSWLATSQDAETASL